MRILKKIFFILLGLLALLALVYYLGPKPEFKKVDYRTTPNKYKLDYLDSIIALGESKIKDLKPNNEARIVWFDKKVKTEYSVVYIHGFSASQMEGHPVHVNFAKRYGANLYLPRLEQHGRVDTNAFETLTPDNYFESAQQALEIGKAIGEKVILMSCSTGGTLSIMLTEDPKVFAHIMFSPNIDIKDPNSDLMTEQWGPQILSLVLGGNYNHIKYTEEAQKYWYSTYHLNGIIAIKKLIKDYMNESQFKKVNKPVYMAYYYENEEKQDDVVSVPRMQDFFNQISTPNEKKWNRPFKEIPGHVICSDVMTDKTGLVTNDINKFAEEILGLKPIVK